jgi:hypothetical protein
MRIGFEMGDSPDATALWLFLLFAGGGAGLAGALSLARKALAPERRMRWPRMTLALVCIGVFALASALVAFDLSMATLIGPLAATMHFLYRARGEFAGEPAGTPARTSETALADDRGTHTSLPGELLASVAVIALALGASFYERRGEVDPQWEAAYAKTQKPDPCTRWVRDGNFPKVIFRLDIREHQWPQLAATLEAFARERGLAFHDGSARFPNSNRLLYLTSCSDAGVTILSSTHRSRSGPEWEWERDRGVNVMMYTALADADWQSLAAPLEAVLQSTWPGAVARQEGSGTASP